MFSTCRYIVLTAIEGLRQRTKYVPHYETVKITRKASDTTENLQ